MRELTAPVAGTVVAVTAVGERVAAGAAVGEMVAEGQPLAAMGGDAPDPQPAGDEARAGADASDLGDGRAGDEARAGTAGAADVAGSLEAVRERHARGLDDARPEAVAKRRAAGRRTARENVADLVVDGTLVEYQPLIFAAQEGRR